MSDVRVGIDVARPGGDFTGLTIEHKGRTFIFTGVTANAILAAMNENAANQIVKMQQYMNDSVTFINPDYTWDTIRDFTANYATRLRNGEL